MATINYDVSKHVLVPKHTIVSEKEKKQVLEKFNVDFNQLPKILATDSAIKHLKPKHGDIIKVARRSRTAGESVYYRGVVNA